MALNETYKILSKNKNSLEAYLTSFLPNKDYSAEECEECPSKK